MWVKHENHQPVGAFKVRGGVNLVSQLTADERQRGVIAASTGNHGQSVAYAADLFGVRAVICILRESLADFVLVTEDALKSATRLMIEKTRNLVEPAGAAALAAVLSAPGRFAGRQVAIVCSGGNISPAQLAGLWPGQPA